MLKIDYLQAIKTTVEVFADEGSFQIKQIRKP